MDATRPDTAAIAVRDRFLARWNRPLWRGLAIGLALAVVLVQWGKLVVHPNGDFKLHWELGRRMVAGEYIYGDWLDFVYPPFWGFAHAPLTVFSRDMAQVVAFPLFFASIATLLWCFNRLTRRNVPLQRDALFWATATALALASRYLVRDMVEVGVNLSLVALSYLGVWLWTQRREWLGGVPLGLAMSLKCTPSLFLVWFLYKRQWKMALATALAATAFTVSPALLMGPTTFATTFRDWATRIIDRADQPDLSQGVLGEEPFQNHALKPALSRYLTALPAGDARPDHPLYFDVFDLPQDVAGWIIKGILAALLLGVGWRFRKTVIDREDPAVIWECAALSLLILLYSPITWGQHCVGILPVLYLLSRRWFAGIGHRRWETAVLWAYAVLILALNRGIIGMDLARLIDSYRAPTIAILALLALAMTGHARAGVATTYRSEAPLRQNEVPSRIAA